MASLPICAPASHSIRTLRRRSAGFRSTSRAFSTPTRLNLHSHLNLRLKVESGVVQLVNKKRFSHVLASNANPPDGPDNVKTDDAAPGPPLLTILAGVSVFLFVCWIIGSVVMWLVGLILVPPPLK